jgi:hypothetical protein
VGLFSSSRANIRAKIVATVMGSSVLVMLLSPSALAAERVVLRYRVIERSVSVEDLTTFVETGETTRQLRSYFRLSGQDPERIRRALSNEVDVDVVPLDRVLNSFLGDAILDQMGDFVHTPSGEADREAMRSALILSASDDNRISLIEVIQNYPTREMHVNGNRIVATYRQIANIQETVTNALERIGWPWGQ